MYCLGKSAFLVLPVKNDCILSNECGNDVKRLSSLLLTSSDLWTLTWTTQGFSTGLLNKVLQ